jgi:hypothetical protein
VPITVGVNPRIRTLVLLPCLLAAFGLAAPAAQATTSWGSMSIMSSLTCNGAGADPGTTAVDTTDATPPPSTWQNAPIDLTLNATGASHMEYMIDCVNPQSAAMGFDVHMAQEGIHTISHRAVDSGGLATAWVDDTVAVDTAAPTNTTTDYSGWHNAAVPVTVTGTDATSSIQGVDWTLDGAANSGSNNSVVNVTGDGSHTLVTDVADAAANVSAPRTDTIQIDSVAPTDQTTYPAGWQYAATTVDLYGSDAASGVDHVEWKLDGSGTVNQGPNHSSISIPEGTHTLTTQIVDAAGNASGWVPHTIMVDLTGPSDTTTVPAAWANTAPVVVTVKGTDSAGGAGITSVEWDVDNGAVTGSGPNNSTVTIGSDGDHILKTRVTDGSPGGWTPWKTQHVKIDTVLPTDTTSPPSGWQTAPVTVAVGGTDGTSGIEHVEWELDGATTPSQSFSNPANVVISGDGLHTLKTRVYDNAGWDSGWVPHTIAIDTTAPANTTTAPPTGWINHDWQGTADMADGGSGNGHMSYHVDANPDTPISPLTQISVTGNGSHTLVTTAYDRAGNSSMRTDTVKIDELAPTDTTVAPGGPLANHATVTVSGSDADSGVDHVEWKLDNGSVTQGATATIDGPGAHTLYTQVWDKAGNPSGWRAIPVTVDVSGDTTAPTDTSTTAIAGWYTTANVNFTASATDASSGVQYVQWRVGGADGSIQQGPSGSVVAITGQGGHHIETRAVDWNGNTSTWREQTVKIDSVIPVDTSSLPSGWTNSLTFTLTGTDATSGVQTMEYEVDFGARQTVASGGTISLPGDGQYTISHRVVDNAGQVSDWVDSVVKVDTVLPANTSPAAPTGWQQSISLALTGTDADSGFDHGEWSVDGGTTWKPGPVAITADGTYTLQTRAVDVAGNLSAPRSETVKVDGTAPANTTPRPAAAWLNTPYATTVAGTDAGSGVARVEWKLDDPNAAAQTTPAVSVPAPGSHHLYTRVVDNAGNASDWRDDSFGIDRTAPVLSVDCGSDAWRVSAAGCSVAADGGESGLGGVTVSANGGAAAAVNPAAGYTLGADGDWTLTFRATDHAGNATTASAHVRVDATAPAAGLSCVADSGAAYTCTASGSDATSGLSSLTYTVDGGAPQAPGPGGSFTVAHGRVVVHATDFAGNGANSVALILSNRVIPAVNPPRSVSEAVLRAGRGSVLARALGELTLNGTAKRSTAVLRPLAVGRGKFKITMKLRADKKRRTFHKTVKARRGYTPRVSFHLGGAAHVTVDLTVRRRKGHRWVAYASGGAELGG